MQKKDKKGKEVWPFWITASLLPHPPRFSHAWHCSIGSYFLTELALILVSWDTEKSFIQVDRHEGLRWRQSSRWGIHAKCRDICPCCWHLSSTEWRQLPKINYHAEHNVTYECGRLCRSWWASMKTTDDLYVQNWETNLWWLISSVYSLS